MTFIIQYTSNPRNYRHARKIRLLLGGVAQIALLHRALTLLSSSGRHADVVCGGWGARGALADTHDGRKPPAPSQGAAEIKD